MNFRDPAVLLAGGVAGAALLFLPGRGLMAPAVWFGKPGIPVTVALSAIIFFVVYFGTLQFWKLLTGDPAPKTVRALLALWLGIRLTVDCARLYM